MTQTLTPDPLQELLNAEMFSANSGVTIDDHVRRPERLELLRAACEERREAVELLRKIAGLRQRWRDDDEYGTIEYVDAIGDIDPEIVAFLAKHPATPIVANPHAL